MIVDVVVLKKFNRYFQYLQNKKQIKLFNAYLKSERSKNELEKSFYKL